METNGEEFEKRVLQEDISFFRQNSLIDISPPSSTLLSNIDRSSLAHQLPPNAPSVSPQPNDNSITELQRDKSAHQTLEQIFTLLQPLMSRPDEIKKPLHKTIKEDQLVQQQVDFTATEFDEQPVRDWQVQRPRRRTMFNFSAFLSFLVAVIMMLLAVVYIWTNKKVTIF